MILQRGPELGRHGADGELHGEISLAVAVTISPAAIAGFRPFPIRSTIPAAQMQMAPAITQAAV